MKKKNEKSLPSFLWRWKIFFETIKIPSRITFFVLGIASTVWFLVRVIPKPSRAYYPCMRTAAPFMSSFVIYLLSLGTASFAFRRFRQKIREARYGLAVVFFMAAVVCTVIYYVNDEKVSFAAPADGANQPMGTARGIMPGRVVWAWDSAATNAYCTNSGDEGMPYNEATSDYYFNPKNNDQGVIDTMMAEAIKKLAGKNTEEEAWEAIFCYFNQQKHAENRGYQSGEIIFIKVNQTSMSWAGNFNYPDFSRNIPAQYDIVEMNPFSAVALIKSLVEKAHVPEEKIIIGESMRNLYKDEYDYIKKYFPKVNILGNNLLSNVSYFDLISIDRLPVAVGTDTIFYSGTNGTLKDNLYDVYSYANYVINIANLKGHAIAGVTLCAKNHFGSQTRSSAAHLHDFLLAPDEKTLTNGGYGKYRPFVDIMGHPKLGGNTLLYVVDGLYSGEEGYKAPSRKWRMEPFNNNYPSSLFLSLDPVAIESVCLDFLRTEYDGTDGRKNYPNYYGTDDYLHQAADKANWPAGVIYKPDGVNEIGSLGVHEHWNNAKDKKYSRNLDPVNGKGIELVGVCQAVYAMGEKDPGKAEQNGIESVYPNPAADYVNIRYTLSEPSEISMDIYSVSGSKVTTLVYQQHQLAGNYTERWTIRQPAGIYICRMRVSNSLQTVESSYKIQVIK